MRHFEVF